VLSLLHLFGQDSFDSQNGQVQHAFLPHHARCKMQPYPHTLQKKTPQARPRAAGLIDTSGLFLRK
jgi:hypothetical protein